MKANNCDVDEIWRDELKEHRGDYFVTYQPADSRCNFAAVGLVFYGKKAEPGGIRQAMEHEIKLWLTRFRVPVMVSSFDATGSFIHLPKEGGGSTLMAYIDPQTENIVHRWGLFQNEEMPAALMTPEHFGHVYQHIPFRRAQAVREDAEIENRKLRAGFRVLKAAIIFVAAIPLAIELVSLGIGWLGKALQAISIGTGVYQVVKAAGWLKESRAKKEEREKKRKMEHYYYHCERNSRAFERLKIENFEREAAERTREEGAALARQSTESGGISQSA